MARPFRTGDVITANEDAGHTARINAIFSNRVVRVQWHGTGWISDLDIEADQVERASCALDRS